MTNSRRKKIKHTIAANGETREELKNLVSEPDADSEHSEEIGFWRTRASVRSEGGRPQ
jgi:hypothetical protein